MKTLFVILSLIASTALARGNWEKVPVPEAICGNGSSYHVFFRNHGRPTKLALIYMGGGACWDEKSCFNSNMTVLSAADEVPENGGILPQNDNGKLKDYNQVFFPYCTGDVFAGTHNSQYGEHAIYHQGRNNISLALQVLIDKGFVSAKEDELVVYGYSAGALGGLIGLSYLDKIFAKTNLKILIADAPGLHFGKSFWNKFPDKLIADYSGGMEALGLTLDPENGNLGGQLHKACNFFPEWQMAFLQGSQDIIMSSVFGDISPSDHERLIFGKDGMVKSISENSKNCSIWVPQTLMHTFLISDASANWPYNLGMSALNFVKEVFDGQILYKY